MKKGIPSVHSHHSKNMAPINHDHFIVPPGTKIRLKDYDPGFTGSYKTEEEASPKLRKDIQRLAKLQNVFYADNTRSLLVVLQGMDAAGKDRTIRHMMSRVNPQGTQVHSFKAPSAEEPEHDLWRSTKALPERGGIGIFDVIGPVMLSRAVRRNMRQNLWWAAGYNVIASRSPPVCSTS